MAQSGSPSTAVKVCLNRACGWPSTVPAPWIVRESKMPMFTLLGGAEATVFDVVDGKLVVQFPALGSQALLRYK
jgi:hypothetical protein